MGMIVGVPALSACLARYGTAVTLQIQKHVLCAFTLRTVVRCFSLDVTAF